MSSDSAYIDEDVYSRESTALDGIIQATARGRVLGWQSFLDLVWRAEVPIIPPSQLDDKCSRRILGRGATMVVSEHIWKISQSRTHDSDQKQPVVVAVKQLIVRFSDSDDDLDARPQHELAILANFTLELRALCHGALRRHTNIVRLLGITWAEKGLPALVVERASERYPTLQNLIENRKLCGVEKADILAGITDGLAAVNWLSLVHGDLKPANILIFEQGTSVVPKLSDFAFSRSWRESFPSGGTEYWNAPENCEFSTRQYDASNILQTRRDMFSLGLLFWYVLNEKLPFVDIGEETDNSDQIRREITKAKESGYLIGQAEGDCKRYGAFMLEADLTETFDDDDAMLSIAECIVHLIHPEPNKRLNEFNADISTKLRTRRRTYETSTLTWNGSEFCGDIWPNLEKDAEEIKLRAVDRSKRETGVRFNLNKELCSTDKTNAISFDKGNVAPEVLAMIKGSHETVLQSTNTSKEDRAEAAWYLAQLTGSDQPRRRHELLLEAAKLGSQHGQINYLFQCFRDSITVAVDQQIHRQWLITSLTGEFVFKKLETYPVSPLQNRMSYGFQEFYKRFDGKNNASSRADIGAETKYLVAILHEAFVRNVMGSTYPPHDQVLSDSKRWATILTAKEKTFNEFCLGLGNFEKTIGPDTLHETAVYGTADVVRDLVKTHNIDIETKAQTLFHPGQATALQVAFLRHNISTVQALVNLGADVLALFNGQTLDAFLIQGDRDLLHWLNHLIPLMTHKHNKMKARASFDSILLSSRAVQHTIMQSNWTLFMGILELRPPLADKELKPALELAVRLRRTEFVLALLVHDSDFNNISQETLVHTLNQACGQRQADIARNTIFPRYYMGLQPDFIQSIKIPQDIAYGRHIAEMALYRLCQFQSKLQIRPFIKEPLIQAVRFNRMPLARCFISDWNGDPVQRDENGETILSLAVFNGSFHAVKYILGLPGASKMIENTNFLGEGPLHLAASGGNQEIIKMLLNAGASPTCLGFQGRTVLHLCASMVNKRAFCALFDHIERLSPRTLRAMINHKDGNTATPFHLFLQGSYPKPGTISKSSSSQDRNMERILSAKILKYVDDINAPDKWGLTPLHYLVLFNNDMIDTIAILYRHGADLFRQSTHINASPFQLMRRKYRAEFCLQLFASGRLDLARNVMSLMGAAEEDQVDFEKVNYVLRNRVQILQEQAARETEECRTKFNMKGSTTIPITLGIRS